MLKWAKVDTVYINNDEYLPRRRWAWNPTLQQVAMILVVVGAIGALVGSAAGWLWAAWKGW